MKCPYCGNEIPIESRLVGPFIIHQPGIRGKQEEGDIQVRGRCFLLTHILNQLYALEMKLHGHN